MKKITPQPRGFIALMATIIISLILLVMALEEGASGFHARFNILGTEAKEQATALAEGCADQATANLITDPNYLGNSTTTLSAGTCRVFPIALNSPAPGLATVKTQAEVRGAYANLAITLNMSSLHLGGTPLSPTTGTLVVYTIVYNNSGGTKTPSDFTMSVPGGTPSSFSGTATGKAVTLSAGGYSASTAAVSGYSTSYSSGCVGTIAAGELKYCVVGEDDLAPGTLTLLVNVINDNGGAKTPSDFSLFIDGASAINGVRYPLSAGTHLASTTPVTGYDFSIWGGDCSTDGTIALAAGDNKTCIINFDDNPPPSVACADTVMMLARSMNTGELDDEKIAAKKLLDLYSQVTPSPKAGVGSYDGMDGSDAQVPISGQLATTTTGKTVFPLGIGAYDQWSANTGDKVSAVLSSDGNASYIRTTTNSDAETYIMQNSGVPAGAVINSVTLNAVAAKSTSGGNTNIILRLEKGAGITNDDGGHAIATTTFITISRTMETNPFTGTAWTLAEVNAWTTKFGVVRNINGAGNTPWVSHIYVTVSYSMITPGLYSTINSFTAPSGKIVSAGIDAADAELNSSRHRAGFSKVMILVSPSGGIGVPGEIAASSSANTAKANGTEIFTINFTGGSNSTFWAGLATNSLNDQATPALENADGDHFFVAPSSSDMPGIFQTIANLACPAIAAPPPPSPPTTGKLIIHVDTINDNGGTKASSDFTARITGGSPTPSGPFTGATLLSDVTVTLNPGAYSATEDPSPGYNEIFGANCTGSIASGETRLCTIINDDIPPPPPPPIFGVTVGEWEEVPVGE